MLSNGTVTLKYKNDIAFICIDNPSKRNALSIHIVNQIINYISEIEKSKSAKVIVLTGAGDRVFASGADLDELPDAFRSPDHARAYDARTSELYGALRGTSLPVIARMGGHALGGGLLLALACDLRVASDTITVSLPVARIGLMLSPHEHGLVLGAAGAARSKLLLFSGRRIGAKEAHDWGLIDLVAGAGELDAAVEALAADIARGAPLAVGAAKSMIDALDEGIDAAGAVDRAYRTIYTSSDLAEGLAAFQARRQPQFTGR